jgi:hypothetical protein
MIIALARPDRHNFQTAERSCGPLAVAVDRFLIMEKMFRKNQPWMELLQSTAISSAGMFFARARRGCGAARIRLIVKT